MKKAPPTRSCAPRFPNSATNISSVCWWKPRSWHPDRIMIWPWSMKEKRKGNANRATLAVARKMVAYLLAVDRGQRDFRTVRRSAERSGLETAALPGEKTTGSHSAQTARSCGCRLSDGDQTPEALFELFQDWQRTHTQSSVTVRMDLRQ